MSESPSVARLRDPVCGMSVRLDAAQIDGLTVEHDGTLYAFCRAGCREAFVADPHRYASAGEAAADHHSTPAGAEHGHLPVIDEGMRRWYDSCSCCLSDAYPDVKAALDAERQQLAEDTAGPGICEVAEATEASTGDSAQAVGSH